MGEQVCEYCGGDSLVESSSAASLVCQTCGMTCGQIMEQDGGFNEGISNQMRSTFAVSISQSAGERPRRTRRALSLVDRRPLGTLTEGLKHLVRSYAGGVVAYGICPESFTDSCEAAFDSYCTLYMRARCKSGLSARPFQVKSSNRANGSDSGSGATMTVTLKGIRRIEREIVLAVAQSQAVSSLSGVGTQEDVGDTSAWFQTPDQQVLRLARVIFPSDSSGPQTTDVSGGISDPDLPDQPPIPTDDHSQPDTGLSQADHSQPDSSKSLSRKLETDLNAKFIALCLRLRLAPSAIRRKAIYANSTIIVKYAFVYNRIRGEPVDWRSYSVNAKSFSKSVLSNDELGVSTDSEMDERKIRKLRQAAVRRLFSRYVARGLQQHLSPGRYDETGPENSADFDRKSSKEGENPDLGNASEPGVVSEQSIYSEQGIGGEPLPPLGFELLLGLVSVTAWKAYGVYLSPRCLDILLCNGAIPYFSAHTTLPKDVDRPLEFGRISSLISSSSIFKPSGLPDMNEVGAVILTLSEARLTQMPGSTTADPRPPTDSEILWGAVLTMKLEPSMELVEFALKLTAENDAKVLPLEPHIKCAVSLLLSILAFYPDIYTSSSGEELGVEELRSSSSQTRYSLELCVNDFASLTTGRQTVPSQIWSKVSAALTSGMNSWLFSERLVDARESPYSHLKSVLEEFVRHYRQPTSGSVHAHVVYSTGIPNVDALRASLIKLDQQLHVSISEYSENKALASLVESCCYAFSAPVKEVAQHVAELMDLL